MADKYKVLFQYDCKITLQVVFLKHDMINVF